MIVALVSALPAMVLGWMVVRCLLPAPSRGPVWARWAMEISLGVGAGLGLTSVFYFVLLAAGLRGRIPIVCVEAVALALGVWTLRQRAHRTAAPAPEPLPRFSWIWALRGAAALSLLLFGLSFSAMVAGNPYGEWDAIAIWNRKAKFLAGERATWQDMNAPYGAAHPGYPLLLSAAIAREWTLAGEATSETPAALAGLFTVTTAGLLCGALALTAGEGAGLLAVLVLFASEGYLSQAGTQYADIPLSFYILATLILLGYAASREWPVGALLLAGVCAGCAAWTKNEGQVFAFFALATALWCGRARAVAWMAAGAAPLLLVTLGYKLLAVDGTESMFPRSAGEAFAKVADGGRWVQIAASFARSVWDLGNPWTHPVLLVVVLAFALGVVARQEALDRLWLALPLAGLLAVDFAIYLMTTADLAWHLGTSNGRLVAQVWPGFLFTSFLLIRPPVSRPLEKAIAADSKGKARRKANRA
jgi:hypothetical protein